MSENPATTQSQQDKNLKVSIKTFGCQMNVYDTEVAQGLLLNKGYEILADDDAVKSAKHPFDPEADVILMNTCSVREHAEDRVYGRLGMLGKAKEKKPDLIVGLMGCMVEEHREKLFKQYPQLDLMIGTRNIAELPAVIDEVRRTRKQVSKIKHEGISIEYTEQIQRSSPHHAWLPIMTGCNKVCTFCIVPITRGSEVSMASREVYREASRLVEDGVKWITLLGQNVNSYDAQNIGRGQGTKNREIGSDFPELLEELCKIEGLERISFTTSHPHDATPELYEVIARNPKISRRFHLPLQSGSDAMLKRMKRLHSIAEYKDKIAKMREMVPDIVVTSDIIVGFSGETEEDHQATMQALKDLRYDGAFIYKYSVRPGTPAAKLEDDVPIEVKERRNAELLEVQNQITIENNQSWVGKTVNVFVEGVSRKSTLQFVGRSNQDKKVIFDGSADLVGNFVDVELTELINETFKGRRV